MERDAGLGLDGWSGDEAPMVEAGPAAHSAQTRWPSPREARIADGFRHFIRTPEAHELSRLARLPAGEARALMHRLSLRMQGSLPWSVGPDGDNTAIPAGYTYLLQLIGHDLVATSVPLSVGRGGRLGTRDDRIARLRLDTIYGGGPLVSPSAYAYDARRPDSRARLRLGPIRWLEARQGACPFRDIARIAAQDPEGSDEMRTESLVADPRNDDHALIAQLTALFHLFHNAVVGLLPQPRPAPGVSDTEAVLDRFFCARMAVTLVYRRIIREDVMRRLLHPAIHAAYAGPGAVFLDPLASSRPELGDPAGRLPVEFSQGAFRFGHAMVRNIYRINDRAEHALPVVLSRNSIFSPANMPLDPTWIVQWSHFFELGDTVPNYSRRIGPGFSAGLMTDVVFGPLEPNGPTGLVYRDLLGSTLTPMWSVGALLAEIERRRPGLLGLSPLLAEGRWRGALAAWLGQDRALSGFSAQDVALLSEDPPLPVFLTFEAAFEPSTEGRRLGLLGSLMIAEAVLGTLAADPLYGEERPGATGEPFGALLRDVYGQDDGRLDRLAGIATMADLVRITADVADLSRADPPFL